MLVRTKNKFKSLLLAVFLFFSFFVSGLALQPAVAAVCPPNQQQISIAIQNPNGVGTTNCIPKNSTAINTNPIIGFLRTVLQFMVDGIGIALVGGLTVGGLMFMTARGNAQQVQKAESIIREVIIGIALYVFAFTILNFIIPGGILF